MNQIDTTIKAATSSGQLKFFNAEYAKRRREAAAQGREFISYNLAAKRLSVVLAGIAADRAGRGAPRAAAKRYHRDRHLGLPQDCEAAGHLKALGGRRRRHLRARPVPSASSDETNLRALASEADFTPVVVVDVACPWTYPDLETALRAMLSAGPAERAIRNSSMERAREAVAASIAAYATPSGGYRLNNKFRYLIARK